MQRLNVKYVPRTNTEQPVMMVAPKFNEYHREFERTAVVNVSDHPSFASWHCFYLHNSFVVAVIDSVTRVR